MTRQDTGSGETPGRPVQVSYVPQGFGLALVLGEGSNSERHETTTGVLRDGSVITLEVPREGGGFSTLAWDPTEVHLDPFSARPS